MSEKLIIEKFGPIKRVEIDLSKILILIGPQSTGKSTIAKLVTIFRGFSFIAGSDTFEKALNKYGLDTYLMQNTFIEYTSDAYSFLYKEEKIKKEYKLDASVELKKIADITISDELLLILNKLKNVDPRARHLLSNDKDEKIAEQLFKEFLQTNNFLYEIAKFLSNPVYIPAERLFISMIANSIMSLIQNDAPLPKLLLEFGAAFETARKNLNSYEIEFLNITYKHSKNEDRVYLNKRKHIQLSNASSGLQSLIPLLLVIENNLKNARGGNTYVIEEPELNLYPKAQYELSKIMASICTKLNTANERYNELIITTHSPYILTAFNNFLLASKLGNNKNLKGIDKILPKKLWVAQADFNAYYIDGKNTEQIYNQETGLIDDNHLDEASEVIMGDFDDLMNLYSKQLLNGHAN